MLSFQVFLPEIHEQANGLLDSIFWEIIHFKRRRWLGDARQLTAAVASLDDRLAFMRICEELKRRNVVYRPLTLEPSVGGPVLHIKEFVFQLTFKKDFCKTFLSLQKRVKFHSVTSYISNKLKNACSRINIF